MDSRNICGWRKDQEEARWHNEMWELYNNIFFNFNHSVISYHHKKLGILKAHTIVWKPYQMPYQVRVSV